MQSGFRLLGRADISRRDAFALILKTGLALKTATLPLNSFAQTATIPVTGKTVVESEGFDNLLIATFVRTRRCPERALPSQEMAFLFTYADSVTAIWKLATPLSRIPASVLPVSAKLLLPRPSCCSCSAGD